MAQSFGDEGPVRTRNVGCLTFVIILVAVAAALFLFRDRWLPQVNQMLGRGTRAEHRSDADDESITVHILPEGLVYHRSGCSLLKGQTSVRAVSLRQARASDYRPCTKCRPPG